MSRLIHTSAPGSTLLLGEHAVLAGEAALVCALDKRIFVTLKPRNDQSISINSELGYYQCPLSLFTQPNTKAQLQDHLKHTPAKFRFVLAAIQQASQVNNNRLQLGFDLTIRADFKATVGFGSSAAVTVAVLGALLCHTQQKQQEVSLNLLFNLAYQAIRAAQNNQGSGADVAASVYGGLVHYQPQLSSPHAQLQQHIQTLKPKFHYPHIHLIYSGYKTPTPVVIAHVTEQFKNKPNELTAIYQAIAQCTQQGLKALSNNADMIKGLTTLATAMTTQQALMTKLGVNNDTLQSIIDHLTTDRNIFAAKISGSGLGDCIIALSHTATPPRLTAEHAAQGIQYLPAAICPTGFCYDH
ncbi:mevalonate kinase [Piscirickettsia salmonis]|uniref:mevalonate kinase family protein n=1 Tax=Piscirickettsia salmonis TaxID=1238 RepID=UPI0012BA9085|nr:GHMP kinase [Piscirickettsia salmonis]QGP53772.1 mevalonate kinase [Piscirickettsia salmonis]QGP60318.1 mevalonate kinase [Piscirickettsia salmonis]QGP63356.1 mevalonate kinase [Piscirickettsia salmonis]